ncbi:MAG: polyprenol monophosphomannose synthase [Actinomycetaceae bacterium]|nr:polyprenol monophosphomannose synthase [Actinomycetaceae bacterium]
MKPLIIIPTYNEKESLPHILKRITSLHKDLDILIVDDNSPDGTGQLADSYAHENSRIHVLHRKSKEGLGRAYIDAFLWTFQHDWTHIIQMDADGSHQASDLAKLLKAARSHNNPALVIGSRYVKGGKIEGWAKWREYLSRLGNLYISLMLGLPAKDATAGFRIYSVDFLKRHDISQIESSGYFFQTDMTIHVHRHHGTIVEVPITFIERAYGQSKLSGNIFLESLTRTTKLGIHYRISQLKKFIK